MLHLHANFQFQELPFFSSLFTDYISNKSTLQDFYTYPPRLESFIDLLKNKKFPLSYRLVLQKALLRQYQNLPLSPQAETNIRLLGQENTFTVTTAHQPSIFFGELYFVFKTLTIIRLAEVLRETFPEYHFVPVFWLGSEDHDFAEISHFRLFGKTYHWQHHQQGAVGRMNPQSLQKLLHEIPEAIPIFTEAYQKPTLSEATRYALNAFFGEKGLLVVDGDDKALKQLFAPIANKELFEQKTFEIVSKTNEKLEHLGYKPQVVPRAINLFYLREQLRKRIEKNGNLWQVVETDITFSEDTLRQELANNPESFSPNVLLRPVYQELVLPNLAYVGGPGELAYWLQLKDVFAFFSLEIEHLQMPMLLPRFFGSILLKSQTEKIQKLQVSFADLWQETDLLRKKYVATHTRNDISLQTEKQQLQTIFEQIKAKAIALDKSLEASVAAEYQKTLKSIEHLEKRFEKAEERNLQTQITQLLNLKEKLFPEGSLQERKDNFLNFYLNYPSFLEDLHAHIQPFEFGFRVMELK
jgi:bacillithiol biosynthesis cysteine-adding enzyme BshC